MRVLISGISSPLAQFAAKELVELGYTVTGFSRSKVKIPGVGYVRCDLSDLEMLKILADDADIVIHIAALSAPWGKKEDFYKTNVEGTRNLVSVSKGKRFIHISTPSIYFDFTDRYEIEESFEAKRFANHYVRSKKMAEEVVDASDVAPITLRPRALFGPGDRVLLPRILKALDKGIPRFRKTSVLVDATYVENAAHAIVCAVQTEDMWHGHKFNITNGEPIMLEQLFEKLLDQIELPYRERHVPLKLAYGAAHIAEKLSRFTKKEPLFTPYTVGVLACSQTLSIEKAKAMGYEPRFTLDEGIKRYANWWREHGNV